MTTASGLRPISQIAVGELVLAWDETTRSTGYYTVTAVMLHTDAAQVHLSVGGEHVETTPEHPFFTLERGWVAAGDLWDGAHVRRADGSYALTLVLWVDAEPQVMYNLTVATAHTFFVGVERALVHNAGKCSVSFQKTGGASDAKFKGFHVNGPNKTEYRLKPSLVDGVIKIRVTAVGEGAAKINQAGVSQAIVNDIRSLMKNESDKGKGIAFANAIINTFRYDETERVKESVADAGLILQALNGAKYEVLDP